MPSRPNHGSGGGGIAEAVDVAVECLPMKAT
jgi:hypothetical protein